MNVFRTLAGSEGKGREAEPSCSMCQCLPAQLTCSFVLWLTDLRAMAGLLLQKLSIAREALVVVGGLPSLSFYKLEFLHGLGEKKKWIAFPSMCIFPK